MAKIIPDFRNRSAQSIVTERVRNESSGYIYRALSWLDLAKREKSSPAFQYGAHDARQGIEQLLFEELVLSVGGALDRSDYVNCLGNSTKLHAIINRLSPEREKLARFVQVLMSIGEPRVDLMLWDHKLLMKYWGQLSRYLHWAGAIDETINSWQWVTAGMTLAEEAALYVWKNQTEGETAVMLPADMHPEIAHLWELFKEGKISVEELRISTRLLEDVLR